jgi:hypothetical protein
MRKRTARKLRRIADRLDPKPARWYASAWQQSANTAGYGRNMRIDVTPVHPAGGAWTVRHMPRHGHRVLADYLTTMDLKKLRP